MDLATLAPRIVVKVHRRILPVWDERRGRFFEPREEDETFVRTLRGCRRVRFFTASDTLSYAAGSSSTWTSAGGSGFGATITCTSLAAGSSRQGVKSSTMILAPPNGGTNAVLPDFLRVLLQCQHTTAPTAGGEDQVLLGFSSSATAGTANPAGLTGTDAAGPNTDTFPQLVFAGSVVVSNNLGTGVQFAYLSDVPPKDQYVCPVIYNNASTAFDATAGHTTLTIVPYWRQRAA